jgi:hypothetical protein
VLLLRLLGREGESKSKYNLGRKLKGRNAVERTELNPFGNHTRDLWASMYGDISPGQDASILTGKIPDNLQTHLLEFHRLFSKNFDSKLTAHYRPDSFF